MRFDVPWTRWLVLASAAVAAGLVVALGVLPRLTQAQGADSSSSQESAGVRAELSRLGGSDQPIVEPAVHGQVGAAAPAGTLVAGMSTATSNTYRTPRGPLETRVYPRPVNYRDANGQWSAISNDLVAGSGGFHNQANSFQMSLPQSLSAPVSLSSSGGDFSFSLAGAGGAAAVSGATASYADALPSTDVAYTSQANGVSDAVTLKDQGAPTSLSYDLSSSAGMTVAQTPEGGLRVLDGTGVQRFAVLPSVAYRQDEPSATQTLPVSLALSGSGWVLRVDTSAAWLREALKSGPVIVDPWVEVLEPSDSCTLVSGTPTTSSCNQATAQIGYSTGSSSASRGLFEFNLSAVPVGANVVNAGLGLYLTSETTKTATSVGAYRVTSQWAPGATWDTTNGHTSWSKAGGVFSEGQDATVNPSVGVATGWVYWHTTKAVQEWVNGASAPNSQGAADYGVLLKDASEGSTNNVMSFTTGGGADEPFLDVLWEPQGVGAESGAEVQYQPLTDKMQLGVNVASGNLLIQNNDLHVAGRGLGFDSSRTWNSLTADSEALGEGRIYGGWEDSNDVTLGPEEGSVMFRSPSGRWYSFIKQGSGYIAPTGLDATLCTTGSPEPCPTTLPSGITYRLIYNHSQIHYDFNLHGIPDDVQDRYGNTLSTGIGTSESLSTQWTDTEGRKFNYGIYEKHWVGSIKEEGGTGREVTYGYSKPEKEHVFLETYKDAAGNTTHYAYTGENLTKVTTPKGNVVKLAYDSQKRIKEITRVTNIEKGTGPTTTYTYYAAGSAPAPCTSTEKATVVQDPDGYEGKSGHTTTYCSNVLDQVDKRIDADGNETSIAFNAQDHVASTTAASPGSGLSGGVESLNYDETGQNLLCIVQGVSTVEPTCPSSRSKSALVTSFSYMDEKNPFLATQVQNPESNSVFSCYNEGHQEGSKGPACPTTATGPAGSLQNKNDQLATEHELKFSYNSNGTISASTDADGHTTGYEYDTNGNLKKITPPTGSILGSTTITVDADSRPHVVTDGAGHIETITYDKLDRITEIAYTGTGTAKTVKFEYDADGNITKREDPTGTTKYTVDALNRVTKEELPGSLSNSYEYDAASNMTSFTDGGGTTKYKYNGLNELESMTEPGDTKATTFAYDNDGRLTKITYTSGAIESYKVEPTTGRPETITAEGVTGTTVPKLTYAYEEGEDNSSLMQSLAESTGNTTGYLYDKLNRLTEATTKGTSKSHYLYKLDGAGNRLSQQISTTAETGGTTTNYVYNSGNLLECRQTVTGACSKNSSTELSAYKYDEAGDETEITPKSDTSGTTFAFNAASELSSLTPSGSGALALSYGGTGQDDLTALGSTTTLQNSQLGLTREVTSAGTSYYARTPNGLLIDQRTPSGHYNPLYDAQGDIIALVNSSAKVERTFRYGPYGENVKSEGTQTIPYPFGFKAGYRMPGGNTGLGNVSNGLYHFGQRYYDPTTGRWTQQDPVGHLGSTTQGNRFLFAGSDPINLRDPNGFSTESRLVSAGGYVAGGAACMATGVGAVVIGVCAGVGGYIAEELFEPEEVF
jgi:RHS repeat-associated protein